MGTPRWWHSCSASLIQGNILNILYVLTHLLPWGETLWLALPRTWDGRAMSHVQTRAFIYWPTPELKLSPFSREACNVQVLIPGAWAGTILSETLRLWEIYLYEIIETWGYYSSIIKPILLSLFTCQLHGHRKDKVTCLWSHILGHTIVEPELWTKA